MENSIFKLKSDFKLSFAQREVVSKLKEGLADNKKYQMLLGVTGSGKTFTIANLIHETSRPALIMAPNKTLAAQLYGEMKEFFPENKVEYFVSYYDYYQPEAYVPSTDTFIEKDASINEYIEQMRLSATKSITGSSDTIIIATVSAIYGLGDPDLYLQMTLNCSVGDNLTQRDIIVKLVQLQYKRTNMELNRGSFRVRGDVIDVYPSEESTDALRIHLFDEEVEKLEIFDPLTGAVIKDVETFTCYPRNHYVTPKSRINEIIDLIKLELRERVAFFEGQQKLLEAQRVAERCKYDMEMMLELGFCSGIENYSSYLSGRKRGEAPPTLLDYLPSNCLLIMDESHVGVPQVRAMYAGDRSRKENLVEFGFRLPSALDNRPLKFSEFEQMDFSTIFVSATPGVYELEKEQQLVEMLVRPTGLKDPIIEVLPAKDQVDNLYVQILKTIAKKERVLVTTLTKKMSEQLSQYLLDKGIKVRYLHSSIDTVERVEILRDLRLGVIDVLVGINLLREGLDLPEVSLVCILDADKEGFLRSTSALIQTVGRCARNVNGRAIFYADKITKSMDIALKESKRRRSIQESYNKEHGIKVSAINKAVKDILNLGQGPVNVNKDVDGFDINKDIHNLSETEVMDKIKKLEQEMSVAVKELDFENAAKLRDEVKVLKDILFSGARL